MGNIGGGAAYKQLGKLDNSVLSVLSQQTGIEANKRAAEKLAGEREQVRNQNREDEFYKTSSNIEFPVYNVIGDKTADDVGMMYSRQNAEMGADFIRKANEAAASHNWQKANEYKQKALMAKRNIDQYNKFSGSIGEVLKDYVKNIDQYNPYDTKRKKLNEALLKNKYLPYTDTDGKIKLVIGIDLDGDGTISNEEKNKADEFMRSGSKPNGVNYQIEEFDPQKIAEGYYSQYKKVNIPDTIDTLYQTVGKLSTKKIDGDFVKTFSGFDVSKEGELRKLAKAIMEDPEKRAWILNSAVGIKDKVDGFTKNEVNKGVDFLVNAVKAKYETKDEDTIRTMTVSEKKKENTLNRGLQRQLQANRFKHAEKMAKSKGKKLTKQEYDWSYRKAVIEDKLKAGDFTDAEGKKTEISGREYIVSNVKKTPKELIFTFQSPKNPNKKIVRRVPNTPEAYNNVLNELEGTKITMDELYNADKINLDDIRKSDTKYAEDIADEMLDRFNESAFEFNETGIKEVAKKYGLSTNGAFDWFSINGTKMYIDGKELNLTNDKEQAKKILVEKILSETFGSKNKNNNSKKDPAGLGI